MSYYVLKSVIFVFISRVAGNKHKNNTRVSTETVRHESTYIISFLTWHRESINDDKNEDLYIKSSTEQMLTKCQLEP